MKSVEFISEGASTESIAHAILRRLHFTKPEVFSRYGDEYVYRIVNDVASFYEGAEELGSSDISAMVHNVMKHLEDNQLNELSPETLASYKKKAGAEAGALDKAAWAGAPDAGKKIAKANKRFSGIIRATNKQFDQDKIKEGQIYSTGGGCGQGMRWYTPKDNLGEEDLSEKMVMGVSSDASSAGSKVQGEAANPAQQAAIAIAMKKAGKKPKRESAIMKGIQREELQTGGAKGLPFPGTYEQENEPFKRKGPQKTPMIAF